MPETKRPARHGGPDMPMLRQIPQSLAAEAAVLGSMMIDPDCIPDVMMQLQELDFFHEENQLIFRAIRELYEQHDCKGVNGLLVREKLQDRQLLDKIGGLEYLQRVLESLPSAASVAYYVEIVKAKADRRRIIASLSGILADAYDETVESQELMDGVQKALYGLCDRVGRAKEAARTPDLLMDLYRSVETREKARREGLVLGVPTGYYELDAMTGGFRGGDMIIVAGRPSIGKTAIVLNLLEFVTRVHGKGAVIYSLEMTCQQLVERVVCSLGELDSNRLRSGLVTAADYQKIIEVVDQLKDANLFIDDTSSLTPFELRTRVRKLSRQHKIDLVAIDYVQLMHTGQRQENRQQEISTISRQMKALAKELNVPVIVLSQLNRSPEGREDHRPRMSDLRESGCLTGDSLVTIADTGCRVPIGSLAGKAGFTVWAYDTVRGEIVAARCSAVFPTGRKQVYVLRTRMGKKICATANHQFYGRDGWVRLDQLRAGDPIASYGTIPEPARPAQNLTYDAIYLLGHVLGNGCLLPGHANQYTTRHRDIADNVAACAKRVFGSAVNPRVIHDNPRNQGGWYQVFLASTRCHTHNVHSAVTDWAASLGIYGLRSRDKFIPTDVFRMDNEHVAAFLAALWETDGTFGIAACGETQRAYASYCTASLQFARDLAHLMLRIGVLCSIHTVRQKSNYGDIYHVKIVGGALSLQRFFDHVVFQSEYHRSQANKVLHRLADVRGHSATTYTVERGICWETVASIEDGGVQECFDMTVPGYHNMEVGSLVVHNSLEQDADVVMLLHREDYYHRGDKSYEPTHLAEVILAKQRNGPTGSVELVFTEEFTKFANRAQSRSSDPF